ncbi:MAG: hypothetical protein RBR45_14205 [Pseudomonas sp.]|nr:hypothetical protein [Pseudomonas sp.]
MASQMYIYLIEQNVNSDWDFYDSAVVVAPDIQTARFTHPDNESIWNGKTWVDKKTRLDLFVTEPWCHPSHVDVQLIGVASEKTQPGVICASFNAG